MKYVHQKDYGAFFTEGGERRSTCDVSVEEPLLAYWLAVAGVEGRPELVVEDMPNGAFFDPGGMISTDEPKVRIEVNGQKLGAWLRGLDTLIPLLRRTCSWADHPDGPPHCSVKERWCFVILTLETARAAADAFDAEYARREDEAEEQEFKIDIARAAAGVVDGRCVVPPGGAVMSESVRGD